MTAPRDGLRRGAVRRLLLIVIAGGCVAAGCSDGKKSSTGSGSAAPPPPPTPPLEMTRIFSLPGTSPRTELFVKPGHWSSAWVEATADADFRGMLESQWVNDENVPLAYPPTGYRVRHERPAVLSKKQRRGLEQLVFTPNDDDYDGPGVGDQRESKLKDANGRFRLSGQMGLPAALETRQRTTVLRDHQSLFVVLASRSWEYGFLNTLDAIAAPHAPHLLAEHDAHYRLVFAAEQNRTLLPASVLGWTTTAYVLWDEFDAGRMSDAQRRALLDWLHWGGTLIVAGPGLINTSVGELAPLMPAVVDGSRVLQANELAPLVQIADAQSTPNVGNGWVGVKLKTQSASAVLLGTPDVPLVVERRVGRGRIVVTAFRPSQPELAAWPDYGSFFNAFVMRRLPRIWRLHPEHGQFVSAVWADRNELYYDSQLRSGRIDPWFEPERISDVRFLGRGDTEAATPRPSLDTQPPIGPGTAAWRDDDAVAETTRGVLRDASGIFVPPASLVLWLLIAYVTAAVPVNWLVFRTLGRTEWAWWMTPVLAVVFTVFVVRAAELDLGFVRSVSETAVVEIQPGYDRGHVVRNLAIYNSLGTSYSITGDDASFAALPAAASLDTKPTQAGQTVRVVRRDDESGNAILSLDDFVVDSGSIGLVRTEQMAALGGPITAEDLGAGRVRITNGTKWELRDVRLFGAGKGAVDALAPGAAVEIELRAVKREDDDAVAQQGDIDIEPLWLQMGRVAGTDALRFVAWSPTVIPGLTLDPPPSQHRAKTVVVAHLKYAEAPPPKMDSNSRAKMERQFPRDRNRP